MALIRYTHLLLYFQVLALPFRPGSNFLTEIIKYRILPVYYYIPQNHTSLSGQALYSQG